MGGGDAAVISTIENFLGIHGIATKSGEFYPNLLENKILGKNFVKDVNLLPWQPVW